MVSTNLFRLGIALAALAAAVAPLPVRAAEEPAGDTIGAAAAAPTDDRPYLGLDSPSVVEGDAGTTTLTFTARLTDANGRTKAGKDTITASYRVSSEDGNTATAGKDYAETSGTLTFAPGETSKTVDVTVMGDTEDEDDETLTLRWTAWSGDAVLLASYTGTGTILDDDDPPPAEVYLGADSPSVTEGDAGTTILTFTARLTDANGRTQTSSRTITASYRVSSEADATATAGVDYLETSGTLTFAPGETVQTIDVTVLGDTEDEDDETLTLRWTEWDGVLLVSYTRTGTILDDDDPAPATLRIADAEADEGDDLAFVVTLDGAVPGGLTVTPSFTDGTATAGSDYTASADPLAFAGADGEQLTFTVATIEDGDVEDDETFTVGLAVSGTSHEVKARFTATGTIRNDDTDPYLGADSPSVTEGDAGTTTLTFTAHLTDANGRTQTSSRPITASYRVSSDGGATATAGTDYLETSGTLTFAPGETVQTIDVTVLGDTEDEDDETLTLRWTDWADVLLVSYTRTGTILDDDDPAPATLRIADAEADEGDDLAFTVTLDGAVPGGLTVTPSFTDGTATAGTDYTASADALAFAGTDGEQQTFTVATIEDGDVEDDETFTVGLAVSGTSHAVKARFTATGTIRNDDTDPYLGADSPSVTEGDAGTTTLTFTARLTDENGRTQTSSRTITASYRVSSEDGATATAGKDYLETSGTLTFAPGETEKTIDVTVLGDTEDEDDETLTLLWTEWDGVLLVSYTRTGTILDDDQGASAADVTLSVNPAIVDEGAGIITVTVTATLASVVSTATPVKVSLLTGGTATWGRDYVPVDDFRVTIPANSTSGSGTFSLHPAPDPYVEGDETIEVSGSAAGATVRGTTITLTDFDGASAANKWHYWNGVKLHAEPASFAEEGGIKLIRITAETSAWGMPLTNDFSYEITIGKSGDSAVYGTDFLPGVRKFWINIKARNRKGSTSFYIAPIDDDEFEGDETITIHGTGPCDLKNGPECVHATTLKLTDEGDRPFPHIYLSANPSKVSEADGPTTVTVTLSTEPYAYARKVTVVVGWGGPAIMGTDYKLIWYFHVNIPANAKSATGTFTVEPIQDNLVEGDEAITIVGSIYGHNLHVSKKYITGTTLTIVDDEPAPDVQLSVSPSGVTEDGGAQTVTVTATSPSTSANARTVMIGVGHLTNDGATPGTDYAVVPFFDLTVPGNSKTGTGTFILTPIDDTLVEPAESITIGGVQRSAGSVATVNGTTLTLNDDEALPGVTLSASPSSVDEWASATSVTVTATAASAIAWERTVAVAVGGSGTATSGTDYAAVSNFDITIAANETTGTGTFTLSPIDDTANEGDETIGVSGTSPRTTVTGATVTLADDDVHPPVALSVNPSSVGEGASATSVTVTATATSASASARTVTVSVGGSGTATSGTDYAAVSDFTINIAANATTGTGTFILTPTQDNAVEGGETIGVSGTSPGSRVTGASLTLTDDDYYPAVTLSASPSSVSEGASATSVTITATTPSSISTARTVTVSVGSTGTATSGSDYAAVTDFTITIAANATSGTGTFTLTPIPDAAVEGDETIGVDGSSWRTTVTGTTLTLTNAHPRVTLSASPSSVSEGAAGTSVTVTATANATDTSPRTVTVSVGGSGTATSGTDYAAVSDITITIAANKSSGTGTFTLTPKQDAIIEGDETIGLSGTGVRLTVTGTTVTLADDDFYPAATLSVNPSSVKEDAGATQVTVTATASSVAKARTVTVSVGGSGTATSGTDYATVTDFTINIAANATTGTGTFTLTPTNDTAVEGSETIGLAGTSRSTPITGTTVTLTDDDKPAVTLSVNPSSVSEGASATSVTVTATANTTDSSARTVTVSVGYSADSATEGTDYATVSDFTITIAANATSGTGTFTLTPTQDAIAEGTEIISVSGSAAGLWVNSANLALTDDESRHMDVFMITDVSSVNEGGGAKTVKVRLDRASSLPEHHQVVVTISVGQSGDTANEGTDYETVADFDITLQGYSHSANGTFTLTPKQDNEVEATERISILGSAPSRKVDSKSVRLIDDDKHAITLSANPSSVSEGASATQVTVTATAASSFSSMRMVTVSVGGSGTATAGTDYTGVSDFLVSIPANQTTGTGTFTLTPMDDGTNEANETIGVSGTGTSMTVTGTDITLTDNDQRYLSFSGASVKEGDSGTTTMAVTAKLTDSNGHPKPSELTVTGDWKASSEQGNTATSGTDYTAATGTVTFAPGETAKTFDISVTGDTTIEPDETFTLTWTGWSNALLVSYTHTATIQDDDTPTVTLSASPSSVGEGAAATQVTVTATVSRTQSAATAVTVAVGSSGDGATEGTDYATVADFTVTIPANATTGTGTFTLTPTQDTSVEGNETIGVSGSATGMTVTGTTVTLTDDDSYPAVTLTAAPSRVAETALGTAVTVTATAASAVASARTVTVSVGGSGTATSGTDYTAVSDFTVTLAANATSGTGTFTLAPTDDTANEGDETIGIAGTSAHSTVTGTILTLTDDDLPTIALETVPADVKVAEDVARAAVTVRATTAAPVKAKTTVTLTIGASGDGATKTTDYTVSSIGTITIPKDRLGAEGWFILAPVQDTNVESDESISVSGSSSGGHTVTGTSLTLTDDDKHPAITLSANPASVGEGASATSVTVTATAASAMSSARTVTVSVGASGTATSGTDYAAVSNFTITIAANATSGTGTFTLTPTQDTGVEGSETIGVTGTSTLSTVIGTTVTLTDDDSYPAVTLSANPSSVGEGASGTSVTVTATAASAVSSARTVTVSVGGSGTATPGVDYATVADFTVTIAANATSGTGTFTLTPTQDNAVEGSETIGVSGTSPHSTVTDTTVTLNDDDTYAIYLSVSPTTVAEDTDKQQVTVTATINLARTAATPLTVSVGDASDQAKSGTDYTAVTDFTVTIPANKRSGTATFDFYPLTDKAYEGFESITISGTTSSGGGGASAQNASVNIPVQGTTLTLRDASSYPALTLSVSPSSVSEGASATTVTVTATASSSISASREVTVSVGGGGTATSGTDYADVSDFNFRIKPDSTKGSGTFTLTPTDDAIVEGDETISVSAASLSTSVTGTTVTLTDDDNATVTVNDSTALEGGSITFTVTLDTAVAGGLTVTPSYTNGTAASGDYTANTAGISFTGTAGEQHTFDVATTDDAVVEHNETFAVGLTVSGTTLGSRITSTDTGTGTIVEGPSNADWASLTIGDGNASEGDSISFTVTLDNAVQGGLTVTPSYTNGTAASGDYTANTTAITFAGTANESHTFKVATTEDAALEANETITVGLVVSGTTLSNRITSTDTGTGTINNDDAATVTVNDASASEGGDITFTVTLDKAVQGGLTVTPSFTDGTAVEGTDYDENTAALSFTGTANETKTFKVGTTEDALLEGNETFTVGLTVSNTSLGVTSTDTGTGTINNDDDATVTVNDASASEGGDITFTVTLDKAVQGGLTVTPSYTDGTAASGDYTANTTALTFTGTADETKTFTVATTDDAVLEANETFTVGLSVSNAPSGVTSTDTGVGTINNDDAATVTVNDASASEGGSISFTVTLDKAVQGGLTVTPSYTNGTTADGDYTANTTAISFSGTAGETETLTVATTEDAVLEGNETFTVGLSVSNAPSGVTATDTGTGTINNDDAATVTINDASASEGGSISFTVTLDKTVQGGLTVTPSYTNGTAASGDYTANTAAISFSGTAGETETLTVATTEDAVLEANETFTVGLSVSDAPSGVTATDTGTGTINNDDAATVSVNDASADEGGDITFTITLDKAVQGGLTVAPSYTDGTAVEGTDYDENTSGLSFTGTAGETKTFKVATTQEAVLEPDETFTVGLSVSNAPSGVTSTDTGTGTIDNDDSSEVTIEDAGADEGDAMTFTVTLSEAVQGGLKVTPGFTDGTATEGTDYDKSTAAVSFAGTKGETQTFTVQTTEDDMLEAAETFTVGLTVSGTTLGSDITATDTGTGTINNDDGAMVTVNDASATEGGSMTFTVSLGAAVQGGLKVTPDFTDGTATEGTDYKRNTTALSFTGTKGEKKRFTVATAQDKVVEGDETFTVGLTVSGTTLNVDDTDTGSGTISNDDVTPAVNLSLAPSSVGEGADATTVTVTAAFSNSSVFASDTTVTVSVGGDGTATSGTDYAAVTDFGITIKAGTGSATGTFTLMPTQDVSVEGSETISVSGTATGLTVNGTTLTLTDDDGPPEVNLTASPASVAEGAAATTVTVTATFSNGNTFTQDTTVTVSVGGGGTAASGTDYAAVADFGITIAAGGTTGTGAFTLTPTDDAFVEGNETISVSGTAKGLTVNPATVTLADDDAHAITLTAAPPSVAEGAAATTVTVTATAATAVVTNTTVTISVGAADDDATNGTDYAAVADFDIVIPAGATAGTATFTLAPIEDTQIEGDESLSLSGSAARATVTGTNVTLIDNDTDDIALSAAPSSVGEGADATTVTVTAAATVATAFERTVTVTVGSDGDAATEGTDYAGVPNFDVTIPANTTEGATTFTLEPIDDAVVEGGEDISVSGSAAQATVTGTTVKITDNDKLPVTLSAAPASVAEDADATTVTVTALASSAPARAIDMAVTVGASGDAATEGVDYADVADFTVTIPADATEGTATFTLEPVEDVVVEGSEDLSVSGSATEATVAGTTVTITDNDALSVTLSAAPASVAEDADATTVTVTATASSAPAMAIDIAVTVGASGDAATEGVDYADVADFVVTIPADTTEATATFTLAPIDDAEVEGDERLSVSGSATRATVTGTTVTITENDQPTIVLTAAPSSVDEGDTETVTVTATLQNGAVLAAAQTITVSVGGGTATAGTDYAAVADFPVTIPANTTSGAATFTLAAFDDDAVEGDETVAVTGASADLVVEGTTVTLTDQTADSNGEPVARDDEIIVDEGGTTSTLASGATSVLANDTDSDTPTSGLTVSLSTGTAWGVLVLNADGTFTYTHDGSENHADAFTYTVSDGKSTSAAATVRITVIPVNDAPVPHADTIQVDEGGTATTLTSGAASVLANDPDPDAAAGQLSAALDGDVEHGTLELNADGTFVYTHDGSETTGDGFTYTVSDGEATRGPVSVVVIVGPMNDRPVARDDTVTVVVGAVATTVSNWANSYEERQSSVLANDSDIETPTDELTAEVVLAPDQSLPPDGFRLREDGTFYYVYRLSSVRTDRFTYTASDGEAKSDPATVFIRILANDPPHFDGDYEFELAENRDGSREPVDVGRVEATDPNVAQAADAVTYAIVHGSVDLFTIDERSGEIAYIGPGEDAETPPASHSLTVRATDTGGLSGDAKVLVRVVNENETPTGSAIPKQTVAVGATVGVGLTAYFSDPEDDPLSYTVRTENPESSAILSLAIDGDTVRVTSVGDGPGQARVEVEARDPGGLTAEQSFDVEVVRSKKEREQALKLSLAGIGRTVATQAVDAVGARFDAASRLSRASASHGQLDINPRAVGGILEAGGLVDAHTLRAHGLGADTLGGLPALGAPAPGRVLAFALDADSTGTGNWTLWTSGATTDFRGRPSEFSIDGRLGAAFAGVDRRLGSNGVLGVAVSRNQGGLDFETPTKWDGDVNARLTTVYPYARWSPTAKTDLWGMVGLGRGNIDMDDGQGTFDTEGRLRMGALGMRGELARLGAVDLAVRADAFTVGMEADEVEGRVGAVEGRAQRARLMLDGSTDWALSSASRLTPSVEVGARIDGGDVETGPGMELGGGLAYVNSRLGLDIAARGRWLAVHRDQHFGEWGGNLSIRRIPSDPDRGLSFSVQPTWGQDASGVAALWEGRQLRPGAFGHGLEPEVAAEAWRPDRMDMEISYGTTLLDGRAALKPFGQLRAMGAGSRHLRVGTRLALGDPTNAANPMRLEILAEQRAQADGAASYGAGLNLAGADIGFDGGALVPFGEVTFEGASGRRMRLGTALQLGADGRNPLPGAFRIEVAAEALARAGQASSYGLALRGSTSR